MHCHPLYLKAIAPVYWLHTNTHTYMHQVFVFFPHRSTTNAPKDAVDPDAATEVEVTDAVTKALTA